MQAKNIFSSQETHSEHSKISTLSQYISQQIDDVILLNPRYLLYLLANIQDKKYKTSISVSFFDGTFGSQFSDFKTLNIDDRGNVILTRIAHHYEHLIKDKQLSNWYQDLLATSVYHGGWNWVPTSAFTWWEDWYWIDRNIIGIFKIPVWDLVKIFQDWNAILWNIWEGEIVLSPKVAQKYLSEYINKWQNIWYPGLPDEIVLDL